MSYAEKNSKFGFDGNYYTCIWKILFWSTCWLIVPMIPFGILWGQWNRKHMVEFRMGQDEKIEKYIKKYLSIKNINIRLESLEKDYHLGNISFHESEIIRKKIKD